MISIPHLSFEIIMSKIENKVEEENKSSSPKSISFVIEIDTSDKSKILLLEKKLKDLNLTYMIREVKNFN